VLPVSIAPALLSTGFSIYRILIPAYSPKEISAIIAIIEAAVYWDDG
jgi:hypothetical protein